MNNETLTTLILPPELAKLVDDYWHEKRLNTRNEAIRELLAYALDAKLAKPAPRSENRRG